MLDIETYSIYDINPVRQACYALRCKLQTLFGRKALLLNVRHSSVIPDNIKQAVGIKWKFETLKFLPNQLQMASTVSTIATMSNGDFKSDYQRNIY